MVCWIYCYPFIPRGIFEGQFLHSFCIFEELKSCQAKGYNYFWPNNVYLLEKVISAALGFLLPGGLHFTTFVMNSSSLLRDASSRASSRSSPALPTKGFPVMSSVLPGASPTSIILALSNPSPGTAFILYLQSPHFVHDLICFANSSRLFIYYAPLHNVSPGIKCCDIVCILVRKA